MLLRLFLIFALGAGISAWGANLSPVTAQAGNASGEKAQDLYPVMEEYFRTYDQSHYMSLWCVRNSQNLYRAIRARGLAEGWEVWAVYMISRENEGSLFPRQARYHADRWSNHAFLIVNGLVLDLDYSDSPEILSLPEYLQKMWDGGSSELFQLRPAEMIAGYTNLEVRESIRAGEFPVFDAAGLVSFFRAPQSAPSD